MADALPALRLPAPPAKRRRVLVQQEQQQPEVLASELSPPTPCDDVAEEIDTPEALPSDVHVALMVLKSRFPPEAKVVPFATRSQLYTLLSDRTTADRELEELRRSNVVRLMQLPSAGARGEEQAVMLTEDVVQALRRCRAALLQRHNKQQQASAAQAGGAGGSGSSAAAPAAAKSSQPPGLAVFGWFASRVLPVCTEVMITHGELVTLLGGGGAAAGQTSTQQAGRARAVRAGAATAAAAAASGVTDAHISLLLGEGFLVRHTASADSYLFSMPLAGAAVRSVSAGRQEILSVLQRRRQPELLEGELEKRKLQRSVLGVRWHVADLVGGGALLRIPTAVGPLLRVAKRGG